MPTATHRAVDGHDSDVPDCRAAGSVESCRHDWPLSVVANTIVDTVPVTSATHWPGPVHDSAAIPEPGGRVDSDDDAIVAGLTRSTTEPLGPLPPSRHPAPQHDAATRVVPTSGWTPAERHRWVPPGETSIEATPVADVGLVPAATHSAACSHATTDSVTAELSAGMPVPSGTGAAASVDAQLARSDPAHSAAAPAASRVLTGPDGRRGAGWRRSTLRR